MTAMSPLLQFVAVTALGLVTTWLVHRWFGLFDNSNAAFFIGAAFLIAYGFIYDRWQDRKRRQDRPGLPERD